jgi:hypothetical protein
MAIYRILQNSAFEPEHIELIAKAYEDTLRARFPHLFLDISSSTSAPPRRFDAEAIFLRVVTEFGVDRSAYLFSGNLEGAFPFEGFSYPATGPMP